MQAIRSVVTITINNENCRLNHQSYTFSSYNHGGIRLLEREGVKPTSRKESKFEMVFESFLLCICLIMFCLNLSLHYPSKEGEIAYDGCDGGVSEELDRGLDFVNFVYLIFQHYRDQKFDVYHLFPIICSGKRIIIVPPAPE